jgi:hypothetical protein
MKQTILFLALLCIVSLSTRCQVRIQSISPTTTDKNIQVVHGPHIALYDPTATSRHELVLMIEGTEDLATRMRTIDSCFATMGFHVVSIDYPNNVNTISCRSSTDSSCFDNFRQEIDFGTQVSSMVDVDSANSVVNRFSKLLVYLAAHDPAGGWADFVQGNHPRWDKIIIAGHSQGAGHAAFLGKRFPLAGVVMFSGPQDYFKVLNRPAPWQYRKGMTPPARHFAFLHLKDPYNFTFQVADVGAVTGFSVADTSMVKPGEPIHSTRHILVNEMDSNDPHGATLDPVFVRVWKYMLSTL